MARIFSISSSIYITCFCCSHCLFSFNCMHNFIFSYYLPIITSYKLLFQLVKSASDNKQLTDNYVISFYAEGQGNLSTQNAILLYSRLIVSSLLIILGLCWLTKRYPLKHQKARNAVSKSLLLSIMIQSWMWFMYLYSHQFRGLSLFKDFLLSRNAVISTVYMPFLDIGYYAGVFYLVELHSHLWYISTKVMAIENQRIKP